MRGELVCAVAERDRAAEEDPQPRHLRLQRPRGLGGRLVPPHGVQQVVGVHRDSRSQREHREEDVLPSDTSRFSSIFPKVRGFVWVDEASGELARIDCEVTEDISVGLFLGKIYKGSHFMQERYEFLPALWLTSFSQYDFDGRKLFSSFSVHERTFYSNYRYIGPPKEALAAIRQELGHAELDKPRADPAAQ
jgi:hypothetical protein